MGLKMSTIQHYSKFDIRDGNHPPANNKTVLIQIKDPEEDFVRPKDLGFVAIHRFSFEDIEDETVENTITKEQALAIADILQDALDSNHDVIVHCVAGICRSSAVAICGQKLGFNLEDKVRLPNVLVVRRILEELGITDHRFEVKKYNEFQDWLDEYRQKESDYAKQ